MGENLYVNEKVQHPAHDLEIKFAEIEDTDFSIHYWLCAVYIACPIVVLVVLALPFGLFTIINFFLLILTILVIYKWDFFTNTIYNFFRDITDTEYFYPVIKVRSTSKTYKYVPIPNLNLDRYIKDFLHNKERAVVIMLINADADENIKIAKLLKAKKMLEKPNNSTLFFLTLFFSINLIYAVMILSIVKLVSIISIPSLNLIKDKELMVILVILLFAFTMFQFIKSFRMIFEEISDFIEGKQLKKIEFYDNKHSEFPYIAITIIGDLEELIDELSNKISNIFQIATPIFFLGYISLIISYFP